MLVAYENHENSKHQKPNFKRFDKLTTLSQPVESLKVERVEGQIPMTKDLSVPPADQRRRWPKKRSV